MKSGEYKELADPVENLAPTSACPFDSTRADPPKCKIDNDRLALLEAT